MEFKCIKRYVFSICGVLLVLILRAKMKYEVYILPFSIVVVVYFWTSSFVVRTSKIHIVLVQRDKWIEKKVSCPVDGCGKGASWNRRGPQVSLEGNHDNPVSGTHQALSYWEPQWKKVQILTIKSIQKGGRVGGKKTTITTARKSNVSKMIDSCDSTVKSLRPC